ncbi:MULTISPECIES: hypothetical protein [Pseudomonas]|uniref:hypothetical protein n=1 Tax=Pseudomonas TaxID=286 RepID=UPI0008129165|nr:MULTISPECIES: hypothetical protein [Pseudomonas]TKJ76813.1 hypothetical protein PspCFBP13509_22160 [Pseudomonas sp. CFBP13509]CRM52338.1 hypothetical protein [Pseudomonas sp. 8 R 14]
MTEWALLRELKKGDALAVPEAGLLLIDEGVYKMSVTQYCLADAIKEDGQDKLKVLSFYWAASDAAFQRAYYRDVESDDGAVCPPPFELMPEEAGATYIEIKRALETAGNIREYASYRVMSDGAFVHKSLEGPSAVYYFRSLGLLNDEVPYAILWKCQGV